MPLVPDSILASRWSAIAGPVACRGIVTGTDWMRADVQERYRGWFSLVAGAVRSPRPGTTRLPDPASKA